MLKRARTSGTNCGLHHGFTGFLFTRVIYIRGFRGMKKEMETTMLLTECH